MTQKKSHENSFEATKKIDKNSIKFSLLDSKIEEWTNEISLLTYEASLQELDKLLECLQVDTVLVEDMQKYYLKPLSPVAKQLI